MKKFLIAATAVATLVTFLGGCSTQPTAPVDEESTAAAAAAGAGSRLLEFI